MKAVKNRKKKDKRLCELHALHGKNRADIDMGSVSLHTVPLPGASHARPLEQLPPKYLFPAWPFPHFMKIVQINFIR